MAKFHFSTPYYIEGCVAAHASPPPWFPNRRSEANGTKAQIPFRHVSLSRSGNHQQPNHQLIPVLMPQHTPFAVTQSNRTVTVRNH